MSSVDAFLSQTTSLHPLPVLPVPGLSSSFSSSAKVGNGHVGGEEDDVDEDYEDYNIKAKKSEEESDRVESEDEGNDLEGGFEGLQRDWQWRQTRLDFSEEPDGDDDAAMDFSRSGAQQGGPSRLPMTDRSADGVSELLPPGRLANVSKLPKKSAAERKMIATNVDVEVDAFLDSVQGIAVAQTNPSSAVAPVASSHSAGLVSKSRAFLFSTLLSQFGIRLKNRELTQTLLQSHLRSRHARTVLGYRNGVFHGISLAAECLLANNQALSTSCGCSDFCFVLCV